MTTERSSTRVRGFDSPEMDFQLLRQLGSCAAGGASIGECLALAGRIKDGDPDGWVGEFAALAERQAADAEARASRGHDISARELYLAACNSFRAAEYYAEPGTPRQRGLGMKSRDCFAAAMAKMPHGFEDLRIPFEGRFIPAYFMTPAGTQSGPGKTLMVISGFDGTAEESYLEIGRAALERGYNLFLFDGPGQVGLLRFHPDMIFRPDYEVPVAAALDSLLSRPNVDPARLGFLGISFGGYFSARAAAHDRRIKALVANSPIVDLHAYMRGFMPFDPAELPDEQNVGVEDIPMIPDQAMQPQQKRQVAMLCRRFGQPTFRDTFRKLREFRLGSSLRDIACPCLAMVGEGEGAEPMRQAKAFAAGAAGPVALRVFTAMEGADSHCQVGNQTLSAAVVCDWLDELFS
ncbi:MAG: prolyl oligopeptidase family serine peptidase [Lentisphaerae bacterium]|nr:prolyl oligopeptidase family serine peptidase [Lentisphaerota bacterium]